MATFIGWRDGGRKMIRQNGKDYDCGVINFLAEENEGRPFVVTGYYPFYLRETILKYLGRIFFPRPEYDTTQHQPKIDRDEFIAALEGEI